MAVIWPSVHDSILSKRRNQGRVLKLKATTGKIKLNDFCFIIYSMNFIFVYLDESNATTPKQQAGNNNNIQEAEKNQINK